MVDTPIKIEQTDRQVMSSDEIQELSKREMEYVTGGVRLSYPGVYVEEFSAGPPPKVRY